MSDPAIYTVGWICAIRTEFTAARQFLDEEHELPSRASCNDNNAYTVGRMGKHNVVIALLPIGGYGIVPAAAVARDMLHSFPNVKIGLMVGIGGGAPNEKRDIRLGDVVVGCPQGKQSGIWQYDLGKDVQNQEFQLSGHLNQPPPLLLTTTNLLSSYFESDDNHFHETVERILSNKRKMQKTFGRPSVDQLFVSTFEHNDPNKSCDEVCVGPRDEAIDIEFPDRLVKRKPRTEDRDDIQVFFGLIASGNTVMKNAERRDYYAEKFNVLCFEMEAAGLLNHFPCLVIRGICDYSDTHKNDKWQGYAAMTAAAFAKSLLGRIAPRDVDVQKSLRDHMSSINEKLGNITDTTQNIKTSIKDAQVKSQQRELLSWLSAPNPFTNYNKALRLRHPGSGQWLLQSSMYLDWKSTPGSFLWLHGIPGCGKTILSSAVIEDLEAVGASTKPIYFYFDFADNKKQSLENAIRSLIEQLSSQREDAQTSLTNLYAKHVNGTRQPSIEALAAAFQNMVHQIGEVWIVLDALDECGSRNERQNGGLLQWIGSLLGSQQPNVHLLVTSRPEQDIQFFFQAKAHSESIVHLQSDLVAGDIKAFVHAMVRDHADLSRWTSRPDIQDEIEDALLKKADGMFRLVACQLDTLKKCIDPHSLRIALTKLPTTLEDTYARILKEIPVEIRPSAIRILQFLTYSTTSLSIEEAIDVIAVDVEREPHFERENRMPVPEEIQAYCSSLVVIVKPQRYFAHLLYGPRLQLAHLSVKEYLVSTSQLETDAAVDLNEKAARASIAKVNLAYLLGVGDEIATARHREVPGLSLRGLRRRDELDWGNHRSPNFAPIATVFPLARYAAENWAVDTKIVESYSCTLRSLLNDFFLSESCRTSAFWLSHDTHHSCGNALHYASAAGIISAVKAQLENGADINIRCYGGCTALGYAVQGGHLEVLQVLLDHCADPNVCHISSESPLSIVAKNGNMGIFRMLLDHGASMKVAKSLLHHISSGGYLEVVQMLLEQGADANGEGTKRAEVPLVGASFNGHLAVVRMLFDHGADIFGQDPRHETPLSAASTNGHRDIVQFLLERGAQDANALIVAACRGHVEIVRMLLDHGVDVNAKSRPNRYSDIIGEIIGTALSSAATNGQHQVVEMLLDNGANINSVPNPLLAAVSKNNIQLVEMLLDNGAEIDGSEDYRPLHAAVLSPHRDRIRILRTLLARGANIDVQNTCHQTALDLAFQDSKREAAQILSENGAHCSQIPKTAVAKAASWRKGVEMVKLLLKHGAERDTTYMNPPKQCGNALQFAAADGDVHLIQVLLDHGADIYVQGLFYRYSWLDKSTPTIYGDAYDVALYFGNSSAARMIFHHGWVGSSRIIRCCGDQDEQSGAPTRQFTSADYRDMFSGDHLTTDDSGFPLFTGEIGDKWLGHVLFD